MTGVLEQLGRLNKLAVKNAYDIDAIDWSRPVDNERWWGPEHIAPLTYLPAYELLNDEEKRRLNQLFSLGVCEQFIWLEENILVRTLRCVRKRWAMSSGLDQALGFFIEEEIKHTEMFWRTLEKAAPNWYPERRFFFFNTSPFQTFLVNRIINNPTVFLVWIWTAIFFEERTVNYCQHYRKENRDNPNRLDPTFTDVHEYHFKDEVRHYQLDQHLLAECYDKESPWKRELAGRMFYYVMKSYTAPRRTSWRILNILADEFPRLKETVIPAFLEQLPGLATDQAFHRMAFSRDSVPKTMELFAEYDELDRLWPLFVLENRDGSIG